MCDTYQCRSGSIWKGNAHKCACKLPKKVKALCCDVDIMVVGGSGRSDLAPSWLHSTLISTTIALGFGTLINRVDSSSSSRSVVSGDQKLLLPLHHLWTPTWCYGGEWLGSHEGRRSRSEDPCGQLMLRMCSSQSSPLEVFLSWRSWPRSREWRWPPGLRALTPTCDEPRCWKQQWATSENTCEHSSKLHGSCF